MLEVCADTIEGAEAAVRGGAGRIELCAALSEGGLTPSLGLMQAAAQLPVPVYAMIRPRAGLFCYSAAEADAMLADIAAARTAGLAGVVLGAQDDSGALDVALLARLVQAAGPMGKTLHRVIDVVPCASSDLEAAVSLGFERILTSGGAASAQDGRAQIAALGAQARGRLSVMPGAGLTPGNVAEVLVKTGASEAHASCRARIQSAGAGPFSPAGGLFETSERIVRDMVRAMAGLPAPSRPN